MTSVVKHDLESQVSDETLQALGNTMTEFSDNCPVGLMLTFIFGGHMGTLKAMLTHVPAVSSFFEGKKMRDFRLRNLFQQRKMSIQADPSELFLTLIELCFS